MRRITSLLAVALAGALVAAGSVPAAHAADAQARRTPVRAQAPPPTTAGAPAATSTPAPPPPPRPGGSVDWRPEGRQVLGRPLVYRGSHGGVELAWLDQSLLRLHFAPGTADPGGPWSWGGQIAPEVRPDLVAAFNGGFQMKDIAGGFLHEGRTVKSLVPTEAATVIYKDGRANVGLWGRDVDLNPDVVSVRQNLPLLVDGGQPVPSAANPAAWGFSVAGIATARSAVGVDANGGLVVGMARVTPQGLAEAMVAAGAVRAMEMDINPDWVSFVLYEPNPDGSPAGRRVMGTGGPGALFLAPYSRDFFAATIKPVVVPGGAGTLGVAPLTVAAKAKVAK